MTGIGHTLLLWDYLFPDNPFLFARSSLQSCITNFGKNMVTSMVLMTILVNGIRFWRLYKL